MTKYLTKSKLYNTEEWHEDFGDCLFFHFWSLEEAPQVICTTPLSSDYQRYVSKYWTHFIRLDFNDIFEQIQGPNRIS